MVKKSLIVMMAGFMGMMSLVGCGQNGTAQTLIPSHSAETSSVQSNVSQTENVSKTTESKADQTLGDPSDILTGEKTQIASPWESYESLADAAKAAGFDMGVPECPKEFTDITYQVLKTDEETILEVMYSTKDDENRLMIRKAAGTGEEENISGDYTEYSEKTTVTAGDYSVTCQGNDKKVNLVTWRSGEYVYAVNSTEGMSQEKMTELAGEVQ